MKTQTLRIPSQWQRAPLQVMLLGYMSLREAAPCMRNATTFASSLALFYDKQRNRSKQSSFARNNKPLTIGRQR